MTTIGEKWEEIQKDLNSMRVSLGLPVQKVETYSEAFEPMLRDKIGRFWHGLDTSDPNCDHIKYITQCEEGCGCNYVFLQCEKCDMHEMIDGWEGCNVDWEFWVKEDINYLKDIANTIRPPQKV